MRAPSLTSPYGRALLEAWDRSWAGSLLRAIWSPGTAPPGTAPPASGRQATVAAGGEGLPLLGLIVLAAADAWAFNLSGSSLVSALALALSLGVVILAAESGLYVALATIPFVSDTAALALVLALVGATLVRALVEARWRLSRLEIRLGLPVVILSGVLVVATVTSVSFAGSLRYLATWGLAIGLYWSIGRVAADRRTLIRAAIALGLSAFLGGLHGLYQLAVHVPVNQAWIDSDMFPQAGTRVFSFWGNPNIFALHLLLTGPVLAAAIWTTRGVLARLAVGLTVVVAGLAMVLTLSRTGWVGLAVAIFFIGLFRDKRIILAGVLAAAMAFILSPSEIIERVSTLTSFSDPTAVHRILVWKASARMVEDYWYSGLGLSWRAFAAVYPQYAIQGRVAFHAHNHYLETLIELGVIGFVVLHWIMLTPLAWVARLTRALRETAPGAVLVCAAGSVAGCLAFGIGEPIFYLPRIILLAWATLGLAVAAHGQTQREAGHA